MKTYLAFIMTAVSFFAPVCSASDYSEEQILHATFAAFQEPGVFSESYISAQKQILEDAARDGNEIARIVVEKYGDVSIDKSDKVFLTLLDSSL